MHISYDQSTSVTMPLHLTAVTRCISKKSKTYCSVSLVARVLLEPHSYHVFFLFHSKCFKRKWSVIFIHKSKLTLGTTHHSTPMPKLELIPKTKILAKELNHFRSVKTEPTKKLFKISSLDKYQLVTLVIFYMALIAQNDILTEE